MGGTRRFKRNPRPKKNRGELDENGRPKTNYEPIVRENADFTKYYKAQSIVEDDDWDQFVSYLQMSLPTAFRISACNRTEAKKLLEIVKGDFFEKLINVSGEIKRVPFSLPWYPDELGWQVELTRKDIRRVEDYFRLHNFLISETETGCISRQETVSMIPPIALDVQPHHKVLDMCAAPGSKTAQLVEYLHSKDEEPTGFVVANDIDNSRCYMLVHQAKRLNSPCVLITNHDASNMPNLFVKDTDGLEKPLKFDRVLCDVPCTGDGTMRKNPDIWLKWNAANGNNLHGVQVRVLKRGLEMLEVGGRLVYSTCSFNPVENEAVIARILSDAKGSVELVEFSSQLPGLKFKRGMTKWRPASRDLTLYDSFDEVDPKWHTQVRPQMFPPADPEPLHLERCLRILPHHQDTGGFFVAVLTKNTFLPWEKGGSVKPTSDQVSVSEESETSEGKPVCEEGTTAPEGDRTSNNGRRKPPRKKRRIMGFKEDPFVFFKEDEPVWANIKEFYGIEGLRSDCLLTRCLVGKKKNIYYVTPALKELVAINQNNIKIINTGVKVFARCDSRGMGCEFRFVQEGLDSIKQYVSSKRRITVTRGELEKLLENIDPQFPPQTDSLDQSTRDALSNMGQGSCVIDFNDEIKVSLVGWKGVKSLRAYIPLSDAIHYLRLIGGDVSKYEINKFKKEEEIKDESKKDNNETEISTNEGDSSFKESKSTNETMEVNGEIPDSSVQV